MPAAINVSFSGITGWAQVTGCAAKPTLTRRWPTGSPMTSGTSTTGRSRSTSSSCSARRSARKPSGTRSEPFSAAGWEPRRTRPARAPSSGAIFGFRRPAPRAGRAAGDDTGETGETASSPKARLIARGSLAVSWERSAPAAWRGGGRRYPQVDQSGMQAFMRRDPRSKRAMRRGADRR